MWKPVITRPWFFISVPGIGYSKLRYFSSPASSKYEGFFTWTSWPKCLITRSTRIIITLFVINVVSRDEPFGVQLQASKLYVAWETQNCKTVFGNIQALAKHTEQHISLNMSGRLLSFLVLGFPHSWSPSKKRCKSSDCAVGPWACWYYI